MRLLRTALATALLAGLVGALPARAAEPVYDVVDVAWQGELLRVEVLRSADRTARQPVILELSPYNVLGGARPADTATARRYVSQGYAYAVADVLGTRGSSGCWDYGGRREQAAGVAVVKWLARQPWSAGRVGMTGGSYNGTTATMVAATGIPELRAIVPVAAIGHWYGYAYFDGVRYAGNSRVPTDEGFDTPLGFDLGFGLAPHADASSSPEALTKQVTSTVNPCQAAEHTQQGYSRSPDYGDFWRERDYVKDARKFRAAVFLVHGWQDYNVKQDEALRLFDALPVDNPRTASVEGVPFKRMWLTQSAHAGGSGAGYKEALDRFWAATLKHPSPRDPQIPLVRTQGTGASSAVTLEKAWPPAGSRSVSLYLGRSFVRTPGVPAAVPNPVGASGEAGTLGLTPRNDGGGWTHVDGGAVSEEASLADPLNASGHGYYSLFQQSPPLRQATRLVGSATLDAWVNTTTPGQHLTPLLVDVAPDGSLALVERGFLNLDYRNGRAVAEPATGWLKATVRLLPQDYTFAAGHRIGLLLQSSNAVWAVPGAAGTVSYAMGPVAGVTKRGTVLRLPLVGAGRLF